MSGYSKTKSLQVAKTVAPQLKACYYNSLRVVGVYSDFQYVEGYLLNNDIVVNDRPMPIAHAWVIDDEGDIIDTTSTLHDWDAVYYTVYTYSTEQLFRVSILPDISNNAGMLFESISIWGRNKTMARNYFNYEGLVLMGLQSSNRFNKPSY